MVLECDPVDDAPILDLRIRKGVRRHDVRWRSPARGRPRSTRAPTPSLRYAPGGGAALLVALDAALAGDEGALGGAASAAGSNADGRQRLAERTDRRAARTS